MFRHPAMWAPQVRCERSLRFGSAAGEDQDGLVGHDQASHRPPSSKGSWSLDVLGVVRVRQGSQGPRGCASFVGSAGAPRRRASFWVVISSLLPMVESKCIEPDCWTIATRAEDQYPWTIPENPRGNQWTTRLLICSCISGHTHSRLLELMDVHFSMPIIRSRLLCGLETVHLTQLRVRQGTRTSPGSWNPPLPQGQNESWLSHDWTLRGHFY